MSFPKWALLGALVATLGAGATAQVAPRQSIPQPYDLVPSPGDAPNVALPYELVPNHFKEPPFPAGWSWGSVAGVYADSPDRIYVGSWGILPRRPQFLGPDGLPRDNCCGVGSREHRREYLLTVFDGKGNLIDHWKDEDGGTTTIQRLKVDPRDPEKHVWLANSKGGFAKYTRDGKLVMRVSGEVGVGCALGPGDLAFAPNGDIWCVQFSTGTLVRFSKDGRRLMEVGKRTERGKGPTGNPDEMSGPHAIAIDRRGRMYVGDRENYRIKVFDENGKLEAIWAEDIAVTALRIDAKDRLWAVCSIGRGAAAGLVNVTRREDCGKGLPDHAISAIDSNSGKRLFSWANGGESPSQFYGNGDFDVDSAGNLYHVELRGGRVRKFRPKKDANPTYFPAYPVR